MLFRRGLLLASACAAVAVPTTAARQTSVWTFDAMPVGAPPAEFVFESMRQPTSGSWLVREEEGARYLLHQADAGSGYALALAPGQPFRDVVVSARLRLAGGSRSGGLVWRYQDPHHFYVAELDLSRRALSISRVVGGNRITIERKSELELDQEAWHLLKVAHDDAWVSVSLGGIRVFDERDRRLDRFGPGRAGLMAKGNSEVCFDDLRIERKRGHR